MTTSLRWFIVGVLFLVLAAGWQLAIDGQMPLFGAPALISCLLMGVGVGIAYGRKELFFKEKEMFNVKEVMKTGGT